MDGIGHFPDRPFYDSELPETMRFKHIGAERQAPFDPSTHLARLIKMADQVTMGEDDGDYGPIIQAEIDALVIRYPRIRDQLGA